MFKTFFVLCAALLLHACSTVTSLEQLGLHTDPRAGDQLSGDWKTQNGAAIFTHNGDGRITVSIKPAKEGGAAPPPFDIFLRHSGEQTFVNLVNPDEPDMPGYLFLRYHQRKDGDLEAWMPNSVFFREAIEAGQLSGEIQGSRFSRIVLITASQAELDAFLASASVEQAWEMDTPIGLFGPDSDRGE